MEFWQAYGLSTDHVSVGNSHVCVCLDEKITLFYAGIEESSEKGKWLAEEPYEVMGDTVAGKTHGPRRARQALAEDEVCIYTTLDIEKREGS